MEPLTVTTCALPPAQQATRLDEFEALWRQALVAVEGGAGSATFHLSGPLGLGDRVRDLTRREHECCSFFTFAIDGPDDDLALQVTVPAAHRDVLAAAVARAEELVA